MTVPDHAINTGPRTYWDELLIHLADLPPGHSDRETVRREAIEGYVPMADRLARRYAHRGERLDDLTQVARLGLVKAVDGFNPELGSFMGYAVPTIQGELKRYFRDQCWDVKVPRRLQELRIELNAATDRLAQRLGHSPTVADIAAELKVTPRQIREAMEVSNAYSATSLNAAPGEADDGCELAEFLGDRDHNLDQVPDWVSLGPALSLLPEREHDLLVMRFFENLTQTQIAERLGLSQMHVSRLLTRTLAALRAWIDGTATEVVVCGERQHGSGGRTRARTGSVA